VREEMEALGFDFSNRGKRTDEYIDVLRELWRTDPSHFAGEFVAFDDVVSNPKPEQPGGVPLIIGGHSPAAARRAGRRGDGFYPHFSVKGPTRDEYLPVRDLMYEAAESAGRDPHDIEITLTGTTEPEVAELCLELGADRVVILPPHGDIDALADDLESFRQRVIEPLSGEPSARH
jgi:alkanesulfonate monooxygenase SsuD/methylene tetrahydromethanopterin reductase-like flavin-dependent oxidoreductase (luciferase family)